MARTKIVCTIGPASRSPQVMRALLRAGMNVARVNFSHGDHAAHREVIATLRQVAGEEGRLLAIMADLQGPKLRVGEIPDGAMQLRQGDLVRLALVDAASEGAARDSSTLRPDEIPVPHPELLVDLQPGESVLLDDGSLELRVEQPGSSSVACRVIIGGQLYSHKGINVPQTRLQLSALTPKDRQDVTFALGQGVDFVALSFVRRSADVRELRQFLQAHGADVPIVAKIEKHEALVAFDEILAECDGVMVARGDLGVETPAEEVPFHQKTIICACNQAGKPVITATQMLQTMVGNPRPTRAEASDVANAILDGTDAVMLSGETAMGHYPVEAVETMARICANAEEHLTGSAVVPDEVHGASEVTEAITDAAVSIANEVEARAIITATMSGVTACMVARHRPPVPVLAVTPNRATLSWLALVWGVTPVLVPGFDTTDEMVRLMVRAAREQRLVTEGDLVVLTAGIPFGLEQTTNLLKVHKVERDN